MFKLRHFLSLTTTAELPKFHEKFKRILEISNPVSTIAFNNLHF